MNAALELRSFELRDELESLRDRMIVAVEQRDQWHRRKNSVEVQYWNERIQDLDLEIRVCRSKLGVVVMPGDGGPDEQRRLEAREDWKRERDSYEC